MEKHYNRRERKQLAKQLGLKNTNESIIQKEDRITRTIIAGKQIHQQFLMQVENEQRNFQVEKDSTVLKSLMESHTEEEAQRILINNKSLEEKRRLKLINRDKKRQGLIYLPKN